MCKVTKCKSDKHTKHWSFEPDKEFLATTTSLLSTSNCFYLQLHYSFTSHLFSCTTASHHFRFELNYSRVLASSIWCWKSSSKPDYLPAVGVGRDVTAIVGQQGPAYEQARPTQASKGTRQTSSQRS